MLHHMNNSFDHARSANLLTAANKRAIQTHHNLAALDRALSRARQLDLLKSPEGQRHFELITQFQDTGWLAYLLENTANAPLLFDCLSLLDRNRLLAVESGRANLHAILNHDDQPNLLKALNLAGKQNLLAGQFGQSNFNAILNDRQLKSLIFILGDPMYVYPFEGRDAQANFDIIIRRQVGGALIRALINSSRSGVLDLYDRKNIYIKIIAHPEPTAISESLIIAHRAKLLVDSFYGHFRGPFIQLNLSAVERDMLDRAHQAMNEQWDRNIQTILAHEFPRELAILLDALGDNLIPGPNAQVQFDLVANIISSSETIFNALYSLPIQQFKRNIAHILSLAAAPNPEQTIPNYVNGLLSLGRGASTPSLFAPSVVRNSDADQAPQTPPSRSPRG